MLSKQNANPLLILLLLVATLFLSGCSTVGPSTVPVEVTEGYDYTSLEDYGDWSEHQQYGTVWRPNVAFEWRPFYYGHWVWSMEGWLWISYEPFGWITYHHGYWYYDPYLHWVWVPGYRWSPAVVIWMQFGDYFGWAPMPPPGIVIGDPWDHPRIPYWNFVERRHFRKEYIGNYVQRKPLNKPLPRTSIIRAQPDLRVVEKITKARIVPVPIERERIEIERKTYEKLLIPRAEADKVQRHSSDVKKKTLKTPPPVKKPPVKKPPSTVKE